METSAAARPIPRPSGAPRSAVLLRLASDERLVGHVRAGSEAAFEALYDRHHRGILGFCRHMLGSVEEAEDALQHTFMAAYRDLVGSDKPIQLRPWLYAIARNRCFTLLRARRERPMGDAYEPATENLSSEVQRRQDLRDLLSDLSALPEAQRAALVLTELGAVSHEEIASVLEVPRDKVKALVFQGRSSLIASRKARDTPCEEIREQLASLHGGALRRTTLRRHLKGCPGCREFRQELVAQHRALAVVLPVLPTAGLKEVALGASFGSGSAGAGAAAALSTAAAGGGGTVAAKALVAVALVGGGSTAGVTVARQSKPPQVAPAPARAVPALGSPASPRAAGRSVTAAPVAGAVAPAAPRRSAPAHTAPATRSSQRAADRGAVPAQGRATAPGRQKTEPAKHVKKAKKVKAAPRGERGSPKPEKVKLKAQRPARAEAPRPPRDKPAKAERKPAQRSAPAAAAPVVVPAPTAALVAPEHPVKKQK